MSSRIYRVASQAVTSKYLILLMLLASLFPADTRVQAVIVCLATIDLVTKYLACPAEVRNGKEWKAVVVGAGISGLCVGKRLLEVGVTEFVILEKASDLGGTWLYNVYPGVGCDVACHSYAYSFFSNPWFSRVHSSGKEIWDYINSFADHFDLRSHIRYNRKVTNACWDEDRKVWEIQTESGEKFEANFFVSCTGGIHHPLKPAFKGQELFTKPLFHTAEWDKTVDLAGKRVAVIGTGASAVQVVPSIADRVKELLLFQRNAAWVPRKFSYTYWPWVKHMFYWLPCTLTIYRYLVFIYGELAFHCLYLQDSPLRPLMTYVITGMMKRSLGDDPNLCETLIPDYKPGCKLVCPSDTYLESLQRENVRLIRDPIIEFSSEGIRTDTGLHEVDVVILATGFDTSMGSYMATGRDSLRIDEYFGECPVAYLGVTNPGFPNMFIILGPSTIVTHNSIYFMVECEVNYAVDCMKRLSEAKGGRARSMEVKASALERYLQWLRPNAGKTVYEGGCRSYFQNKAGKAFSVWPKSCTEYWWSAYSCQEEDYIFD